MEVHKIDYGQRVYQGTLDAVRQVIIATMLVIDSYNGETIGEPWISDRDEYVAGTTPSTGAQVAYTLDAPLEIPVTVTNLPVKSLSGYNHIESSTGDMTIDYITDAYQNFVDTVESALPSTRKGGIKAFDIFATLDNPSTDPEPDKDSDEGDKKVEEEVKDEGTKK